MVSCTFGVSRDIAQRPNDPHVSSHLPSATTHVEAAPMQEDLGRGASLDVIDVGSDVEVELPSSSRWSPNSYMIADSAPVSSPSDKFPSQQVERLTTEASSEEPSVCFVDAVSACAEAHLEFIARGASQQSATNGPFISTEVLAALANVSLSDILESNCDASSDVSDDEDWWPFDIPSEGSDAKSCSRIIDTISHQDSVISGLLQRLKELEGQSTVLRGQLAEIGDDRLVHPDVGIASPASSASSVACSHRKQETCPLRSKLSELTGVAKRERVACRKESRKLQAELRTVTKGARLPDPKSRNATTACSSSSTAGALKRSFSPVSSARPTRISSHLDIYSDNVIESVVVSDDAEAANLSMPYTLPSVCSNAGHSGKMPTSSSAVERSSKPRRRDRQGRLVSLSPCDTDMTRSISPRLPSPHVYREAVSPEEWTTSDVSKYLEELKLPELQAVFTDRKVTGGTLLALSEIELETTFAIKKFWMRQRLSLGISRLRAMRGRPLSPVAAAAASAMPPLRHGGASLAELGSQQARPTCSSSRILNMPSRSAAWLSIPSLSLGSVESLARSRSSSGMALSSDDPSPSARESVALHTFTKAPVQCSSSEELLTRSESSPGAKARHERATPLTTPRQTLCDRMPPSVEMQPLPSLLTAAVANVAALSNAATAVVDVIAQACNVHQAITNAGSKESYRTSDATLSANTPRSTSPPGVALISGAASTQSGGSQSFQCSSGVSTSSHFGSPCSRGLSPGRRVLSPPRQFGSPCSRGLSPGRRVLSPPRQFAGLSPPLISLMATPSRKALPVLVEVVAFPPSHTAPPRAGPNTVLSLTPSVDGNTGKGGSGDSYVAPACLAEICFEVSTRLAAPSASISAPPGAVPNLPIRTPLCSWVPPPKVSSAHSVVPLTKPPSSQRRTAKPVPFVQLSGGCGASVQLLEDCSIFLAQTHAGQLGSAVPYGNMHRHSIGAHQFQANQVRTMVTV